MVYNILVLKLNRAYIGISPSGKASDSDSDIVGSNPAIPARKKTSFFETCLFFLCLIIS